MTHVSLQDRAIVKQHGYKVEKFGDMGWLLRDADGGQLMIGSYGGISPTEWEAYAEALRRIAQDSREIVPFSMMLESLEDVAADLERTYTCSPDAHKYVRWAIETLRQVSVEHPGILNSDALI